MESKFKIQIQRENENCKLKCITFISFLSILSLIFNGWFLCLAIGLLESFFFFFQIQFDLFVMSLWLQHLQLQNLHDKYFFKKHIRPWAPLSERKEKNFTSKLKFTWQKRLNSLSGDSPESQVPQPTLRQQPERLLQRHFFLT